MSSMDWCSWLSKTTLEPSLTYQYGLAFTRNELEKKDLVYFNHEFLLSLGINIAKHRLEILNLASKELEGGRIRGNPNGLSRIFMAFNRTKKLFTKLGFQNNSTHHHHVPPDDLSGNGAVGRFSSSKENKQLEETVIRSSSNSKNIVKSGPLDRIFEEKRMMTNNSKCLSVSGPLDAKLIHNQKWMPLPKNCSPIRTGAPVYADGKWRERSAIGIRSPSIHGHRPWEGRSLTLSPMLNHHCYGGKIAVHDADHSLWSLMFQDMKPT